MQFVIDNIILIGAAFISGALLVWPLATRGSGARVVNTLGATQMLNSQNALLIDIREPAEIAKGSAPQALHIPSSALAGQMDDIKKRIQHGKGQAPVILMCQSGWRGAKAGRQLRKAGVEAVFNLEGGFDAWQQAGLPVTKRS
ncbi:MAG: rhodanese-like domain-containing protein [Burkholderiaceae bacterium]|nr:rhodanese-like domain-containing protein [Burkholderiaceae bacterium]